MTDITVKRFEELESYQGQGRFLYAGRTLGVTAWGMNILHLPPKWADYPDHDHATDGQEEVYVVLKGSATLLADDRTWELAPGEIVRVGPGQKRRMVPGAEGVTMLALGGTPGKAYEPRPKR